MNKTLLILALTTLASLGPLAVGKDAPPAENILAAVRHSTAQNEELTLDGHLRQRETGKKHPFRMTIRRTQIAFLFEDTPQHTVVLDLGGETFRLRERHNGQGEFLDVPPPNYGQPLRGTGINYLDISLAYLYWPNPTYIKEDVVSERITWLVQVNNPRKDGPYAKLDIWVDQNTGGLLRMQGYDWQGRLVKKMEVKDVQTKESEGKKVWTLKKMEVLALDPEKRRVISRTYMEMK